MTEHDQVLTDIVDYVYDYQIQNPASYARARELFLDTLGCAIEGISNPDVRAFVGPIIPGSVFPGGCRIAGTSIREDPVKAAFDFGSMIRYLDHNDGLIGAEWGHPSDNLGAIVPAMDWLAQGQSQERDNGDGQVEQNGQGNGERGSTAHRPEMTIKTLLTAMIKAYEIQGCFQIANSFNALGFDHTLLIKIACTPVLAWLLGLTRQQALSALSQAWMDGHALRTYRATVNTCSRKGWAAGDSCMRAVHLTMLVRAGQGGAPQPLTEPTWGFYARIFRGKEFVFPQPYGETVLFRTLVKLIPCEGHALTAAEAALEVSRRLREERRVVDVLEEVAKVEIRTHKPAMTIIDKKGPLVNAADRDHCMQFIVAVVLLKGEMIESVDYFDEGPFVRDPRVDVLRGRISMKEDPALTRDYYEKLGENHLANGITVTLKDGTKLPEVFVRHPIGCVLSESKVPGMDIMSKFRRNMSRMFSNEEIEKLETVLLDNDLGVDKFIDMCVR